MILVQRDDYNISAEFLWFGVILHNTVHVRYTKTVRRKLASDFRTVANSISQPIYVFQTMAHDPKKMKFIETLGCFSFDHYRVTGEGEWAKMYRLLPLEVPQGFFRPIQRRLHGFVLQTEDYRYQVPIREQPLEGSTAISSGGVRWG